MSGPKPVVLDIRDATFRRLCSDFKLSDPATEHILASQLESLEDFRYRWVREEDVASFLRAVVYPGDDRDAEAKAKKQEVREMDETRLRRAWCAVRAQGVLSEAD